MEEAPCMKGGTGETSYTNNSILQRSIIRKVKPLLEESIRAVIVSITTTNPPEQCLKIADLGCSSGPNSLAVLESIIDVTLSTCNDLDRLIPEFNMLVNDLPQNDFNTVFRSLPGFYKKIKEEKGIETGCFVSGTPGSFHGRLFPNKSVHFMHSTTSLHFLSQIPKGLNGGCICANESTPAEFVEAYKHQFAEDLNMFLRCRSKEIVDGGRMLISLPCSHDGKSFPLVDLFNRVLNKVASQGLLNKEKLESFNLQIYMPSTALVKQVIEEEGSFIIDKEVSFSVTFHEAIMTSSSPTSLHVDIPYTAKVITNMLRAANENTLAANFGEDIVDPFFSQLQEMVIYGLNNGHDFASLCIALSLIAK